MRPTLLLNPRCYPSFAAMAGFLLDGASAPSDLQRGLRATYPEAAVHPRTLSGEAASVWYVYRDGHWVSGGAGA